MIKLESKAPDRPSYWFGGLNGSHLKLFKWSIVGPRPGLVRTMDYWLALVVHSLGTLISVQSVHNGVYILLRKDAQSEA